MKTKNIIVTALSLFVCLIFFERAAAAPVTFVMETDYLTLSNGDTITDYSNASMVFRITIDDRVRHYEYNSDQRFSPTVPVIDLQENTNFPEGTYFNYIQNWTVDFYGDAAYLGSHTGTGGGLPWESYSATGSEGVETYYDCLWGVIGPTAKINASIPEWGYLPLWIDQNGSGVGYLDWPNQWAAVGQWYIEGQGYIGFGGYFNPVPEPAGLLLLATGIVGLFGAMRKKLAK